MSNKLKPQLHQFRDRNHRGVSNWIIMFIMLLLSLLRWFGFHGLKFYENTKFPLIHFFEIIWLAWFKRMPVFYLKIWIKINSIKLFFYFSEPSGYTLVYPVADLLHGCAGANSPEDLHGRIHSCRLRFNLLFLTKN